ncbi:MAG: TonB-dependent receptor [Gemmatimonadaceae bacterium]|nr:TonB-dependent receptor [Gemmatimonadaceae bacterium]
MQILSRCRARAAAAVVVWSLFASAASAQQATTTATLRGTVVSPDNTPVAAATVVATNVQTGTRRGTQSDDRGRYTIPFLEPGIYAVRTQRIGYRPAERTGLRLSLGQVETQDFRLEGAATQLGAIVVTSTTAPLIEGTKTGTSTRILEEQLRQLPTSDRNFKNLVVLTPGSSDVGATGAGGGQSIGGGRTASSNLLMDGVNNNESYFGGDARGGDRLPFSYSIEAVKEIQVITAGYDVERGQFTGGTVNAVTKSGTNTFAGSIFDYERGDKRFGLKLTGNDFLGRRPRNYMRQQYGGSVGGPIIKDRLHFFLALDRQVGNEPKPVLQTGTDAASIRASGINPDTLAKLINIARTTYGYDLAQEIGPFKQNIDESAVFGRVDWQINDRHTLTVRDNYLNFQQTNDRLTISPSTNETTSNAGPYKEKTNSAVVALTSVLSPRFSNELRAQLANDRKPRPSNPSVTGGAIPQVRVGGLVANPGDGGSNVTTAVLFGSDPVLHANNLEQDTYELIDNLRYTRENHTIKVGTDLNKVHVFNDFFFNGLGSFSFNNLADFQNRVPASFTRALPFTPTSGNPVARFNVYEAAVYAQDEWQVTPKLFLTYGLRYDVSSFPDKPTPNPRLASGILAIKNDIQPADRNNLAPRVGFTYDPSADGRQVFRGGSGIFYGRAPYVLYGNTLSNTGLTQLDLNCQGAAAPQPNLPAYGADQSTIPTTCVGGGAAAASKASPVVFANDFQQTQAWKTNLAYDRLIAAGWRLTLEGVYTRTTNDYVVQDVNLDATPRFTIEGGIPVFQTAASIPTTGTNAGRTNIAFSRRDANFYIVFVQSSKGEARSAQGIVQVQGATRWVAMLASYTYDHTRDFNSSSCCIAGGDLFNSGRTAGNPNDFASQYARANYARTHSVVISPSVTLPYGVLLSGIYRGFSGLPWTPTYGTDVNGDGVANDRLYVPTTAEITGPGSGYVFFHAPAQGLDSAVQRTQFAQSIQNNACLSEHQGQIISRNACQNPWQNVLDARIAKRFETTRGQGLELSVDFFNLLNGLKSEWGQRNEVQAVNTGALTTRGFNGTRYIYQYNTNFAKTEPSAFGLSQQFQVQLGARYSF